MSTTSYELERPSTGLLAPAIRRWPLLVLLGISGCVIGFLWFSFQKPVYESTARIQVSKRIDNNSPEGRLAYVEDYVATMTQIIASDAVLNRTANIVNANELAMPLSENPIARLDTLKAALSISRVRDPNAVTTTSSSVLTLKYTCGDPRDAQKILEAVIGAIQSYLAQGYSEALKKQVDSLTLAIEAKDQNKKSYESQLYRKKEALNNVTSEEMPLIRNRITTNGNQSFTLELELIGIDRDLKAIDGVGQDPVARATKLRQLMGQSRTLPEVNSASGPESALFQLTARRLELVERMGKDHPTLKEVDGQIRYYQELLGKVNAGGPNPQQDDLALYQGRLRERKLAIQEQRNKIIEQINKDEETIRQGAGLQDSADTLRRQLDEATLDLARLRENQQTLTSAMSNTTRAYESSTLDNPRLGRKVGPVLMSWLMPGLAMGLLVGLGLAYLAELADQSYRNPAEIRRRLGVPVFGHIPPINLEEPATADISLEYDRSLVVALRPKSVESETYRGLRTQLLVATNAAGHKLIQVTSPNPGDGKSTTASNMAISLAQAGKRVILIDADFRKPRIHRMFAITKPEVGLASVVDGSTELEAAIRPSDVDNLFLLPCGPRPANPAELLASERFSEILNELKLRFDHVIIDTPPLLVVSDPLVVAQRADAVVLVFGITRRTRPQVERARELLSDTGATLIGVVVNGMNVPHGNYGYPTSSYKYSYSYEYSYAEEYSDPDASKT